MLRYPCRLSLTIAMILATSSVATAAPKAPDAKSGASAYRAPPPPRRATPKSRVAVTSLSAHGVDAAARPRLYKALAGGLAVGGLEVVDHATVQKTLAGQAGLTGCETAVCLKQIGRLTKAPLCAKAAVEASGSTYRIEVVLTATATGQVVARVERRCDVCTLREANESLSQTAQDAGKKLLETWTPPREPPRRVEPPPPRRRAFTPTPDPDAKTRRRMRQYSLAGYITLAAGAALLIPGAVMMGLDGRTREEGCGAPLCVYKTKTAGGVFTGLGIGALAAGGALLVYSLLRKGKEHPRAAVAVTPTPGGAWVQGTVRF